MGCPCTIAEEGGDEEEEEAAGEAVAAAVVGTWGGMHGDAAGC